MTLAVNNTPRFRALLTQITAFAFFAAVILNGSVNLLAGIALITAIVASVWLLPTSLRALPAKSAFTKAYIYIFLSYTLIVLLNVVIGRSGTSGYGLPLLFPLGFLVSMSVLAYCDHAQRDPYKIIVAVSAVHSMLLMLVSFGQVWLLDLARSHGSINAIPFAHLLTLSGGIVAIWLFQESRSATGAKKAIALLVWLVAYIFAVHLTGTRGAIIAIFPLLAMLMLANLRTRKSGGSATLGALAVAFTLLSLLVQNSNGFAEGAQQIGQTLDGHENVGSMGMRLGMWEEAWQLITARPLTGHGLYLFREIHSLPIDSKIYTFGTAHNQILNLWMRVGIAGPIFILLVHTLPVIIGCKLIARGIDERLGLTLIWLGGSFFTFGLTYIIIGQTNTSVILATYTPLLLLLGDKKFSESATNS